MLGVEDGLLSQVRENVRRTLASKTLIVDPEPPVSFPTTVEPKPIGRLTKLGTFTMPAVSSFVMADLVKSIEDGGIFSFSGIGTTFRSMFLDSKKSYAEEDVPELRIAANLLNTRSYDHEIVASLGGEVNARISVAHFILALHLWWKGEDGPIPKDRSWVLGYVLVDGKKFVIYASRESSGLCVEACAEPNSDWWHGGYFTLSRDPEV